MGYSPWDRKESDTTEQHTHLRRKEARISLPALKQCLRPHSTLLSQNHFSCLENKCSQHQLRGVGYISLCLGIHFY